MGRFVVEIEVMFSRGREAPRGAGKNARSQHSTASTTADFEGEDVESRSSSRGAADFGELHLARVASAIEALTAHGGCAREVRRARAHLQDEAMCALEGEAISSIGPPPI